jgi:hypothetical protein
MLRPEASSTSMKRPEDRPGRAIKHNIDESRHGVETLIEKALATGLDLLGAPPRRQCSRAKKGAMLTIGFR